MSISTLDATSAYNRVLGATPAASAPDDTAAPAASFGGMVESLVGEASGSLRQAETASAKQVAGKGDLVDVVTAIGAAETALNTVVAVRDRVVSAYTEIMHMQI
jgi:flagellar hook-basal body complex protein FliE